MVKDLLEEITELIGMLDSDLSMKLLEVLARFMEWIEIARAIPEFVKIPVANIFLHQVVWVLKEASKDSVRYREIALKWTIKLFDVESDWRPSWYVPTDSPA